MNLTEKAKETLNAAYQQALNAPNVQCPQSDFIDAVLDSNQLTYKYILFTALVAKATNGTLNPLCLQAKSSLPGAYDARSVCHKVIVPFEADTLKKALGGSNEPFLNKPARTPELSKENATRGGEARKILYALCDRLPFVKTSDDARQCLVYLLCKLIRIRDEWEGLAPVSFQAEGENPRLQIRTYINRALEKNYGGEILTLMVAGVYHFALTSPEISVEVHPVNQSGASGREVSDLDIYRSGTLLFSNELKDKEYSETDVRHAADKVIRAGGTSLFFIEGPRGREIGDFVKELELEYTSRNFLLKVISFRAFFDFEIPRMAITSGGEFVQFILDTAHEKKFKRKTINFLRGLAEEMFEAAEDL